MKILKIFILFTIIGVTGCTSKSDSLSNGCYKDNVEAPSFVCTPYIKGKITALGSARFIGKTKDEMSFQFSEALANGRDELARQIKVTFSKLSANTTSQKSNATIINSRMTKSWIHPKTKTLFVLMESD